MIRGVRLLAAIGVLAAIGAGCKGRPTDGGKGTAPPPAGAQRFLVAVHAEAVPAEKVDAFVEAAAEVVRRRLALEGYEAVRVERAEGTTLSVEVGNADVRPEDLGTLVQTDASLAFRLEAGTEAYRKAVWPRKAPSGYCWLTKPVDPHDVVAGATYRLLVEDRPAVTGRDAIVAETCPGLGGTEVLITLTPAAIAALQAALARATSSSRVAITVNDVLVAAPQFGTRIDGADVCLSGAYDAAKAQAIAAGLNAAIVPPHLELLTEQTLGPPETDAAHSR